VGGGGLSNQGNSIGGLLPNGILGG
jgi:hypothetical protein